MFKVKKEKKPVKLTRMRTALKNLPSVLLIGSVTLAMTEGAVRLYRAHKINATIESNETEHGFSQNPFMLGYDLRLFEYDVELGFRFPGNKIIGKTDFLELEDVIRAALSQNSPVILNMGDSSTSGWNSDNVSRNGGKPFFSYKTYPDLLLEKGDFFVINCGVPGYSSLQGKLYLKRLLDLFESRGVNVSYVTIYFGNNDSTWNLMEDKYRIEDGTFKLYLYGFFSDLFSTRKRVSVSDFKENILDLLNIAKKHGAEPILIVPPVHFDWEPGLRSKVRAREFAENLERVSKELRADLLRARDLYATGDFMRAYELDLVIPRIKPEYLQALRQIISEQGIPFIDVQDEIPFTSNDAYFVDFKNWV